MTVIVFVLSITRPHNPTSTPPLTTPSSHHPNEYSPRVLVAISCQTRATEHMIEQAAKSTVCSNIRGRRNQAHEQCPQGHTRQAEPGLRQAQSRVARDRASDGVARVLEGIAGVQRDMTVMR